MTSPTMPLAATLDRSFGRLEGALAAFGKADGLLPMLRRAEVVASSRLDGNQASLLDLLDAEAGLAVAGSARDVADLRALSETAGSFFTAAPTIAPGAGPQAAELTAAWLLEIHAGLMKRLGRTALGWRTAPMWIGPSGATRAEARHVPPPPDQVETLMQKWEQSLVLEAGDDPLVKLSNGLAGLETIHPFTEANARIARLWLQHGLMQAGFVPQPILLWSVQLQRRQNEVRKAIQALRSGNEDDAWTALFISMLRQAADETTEVVCRVAALRSRHRQTIIAEFGRAVPQALRLADALLATPMIDIKGVIELTGVTFPAANELVRRFEGAGLLVEVTGNSRNRRFRYAPYVRIFLDDE
jgi:Fic family protein